MPNTESAKKRQRQSLKRRARNRAAKSVIKTHLRNVREAIAAGNTEAIDSGFRATVKKLDQTAARGIIHRNSAGRLKSRLSAAIKAAKAKAAAPAEAAAPAAKPKAARKSTKKPAAE